MRPVHFYASKRHLVDHLAPIWHALEPAERGRFFATSQVAAHRARALGIDPDPRATRALPEARHLALEGHQPPIVVAGYPDAKRAGHRRPVVLLEHGAGQTYTGDASAKTATLEAHYAGGTDRGNVSLFLCPNQAVARANLARYPLTPARVVGCPKLDAWATQPFTLSPAPTVAFSFHAEFEFCPEARTALPHYREAVEVLARAPRSWAMLGHGHPNTWPMARPWWESLEVPTAEHFAQVLEVADLYVCDNSSTLFEFAATGRPVVVLNAPWYRRSVNHGLRFWRWANIGPQVDEPDGLPGAIASALADPDPYPERRREMTAEVYGDLDGQASARAVAAMREVLP